MGLAHLALAPTALPSALAPYLSGLLEVSGRAPGPPGASVRIWPQVRDVRAEQDRLAAAGARVVRKPAREPWGLVEMWIEELQVVPMGGRADQPLRHG